MHVAPAMSRRGLYFTEFIEDAGRVPWTFPRQI